MQSRNTLVGLNEYVLAVCSAVKLEFVCVCVLCYALLCCDLTWYGVVWYRMIWPDVV